MNDRPSSEHLFINLRARRAEDSHAGLRGSATIDTDLSWLPYGRRQPHAAFGLLSRDVMTKTHRSPDASPAEASAKPDADRQALIDALNEDLAREYQAVIAYVSYSQVLKGAEFMAIAKELETHASEELQHALIIAKQVDYLGGTPAVEPKPVKMSDDPRALLRFDLQNEADTIRNYRERIRQCEALAEFAISEEIREILRQEQEHLIDLATALGEDVPRI